MQAVKEQIEPITFDELLSSQDYQVKNLLLTQPSDWFIEEETFKAVKDSIFNLKKFYKNKGLQDLSHLPIKNLIKEPVADVYTLPLFSDIFCDILKDEMTNIQTTYNFVPNPDEDSHRQIPEIVLQELVPNLYMSLMTVVFSIFNPIFLAIWGRHVTGGGIQIANYNLKDKKQGAWHHDSSADISVVVPLNTGEYEGGGTEFAGRGIVDPIPTGHALMFPSFTHMHRGLAVESGNRYLLVFWLTCKQSLEDKEYAINFEM